jgi:hypothetical protein
MKWSYWMALYLRTHSEKKGGRKRHNDRAISIFIISLVPP